jgi:hypothetical protein
LPHYADFIACNYTDLGGAGQSRDAENTGGTRPLLA